MLIGSYATPRRWGNGWKGNEDEQVLGVGMSSAGTSSMVTFSACASDDRFPESGGETKKTDNRAVAFP
jgi:hypothetical protein